MMTNFNNDEKVEDERSQIAMPDTEMFKDHVQLRQRLQKTLYYSKFPTTDCPSLPLTGFTVEWFSTKVPDHGLKVLDMHYAASVSRKACISPCSMMLAMMYLEQLRKKNPEYLQTVSSCDLFLVSMMVASKFLYDEGEVDEVFNSEWAASANMDVKELNKLEMEFLAAIDWQLYIKSTDFFNLIQYTESRIAQIQATKREWLTYTEIWVLTQGSVLLECWTILIDGVVQIILVSMVAYVAAALMLKGTVSAVNHCCLINRGYFKNFTETVPPLKLKLSNISYNVSSEIETIKNQRMNFDDIQQRTTSDGFHLQHGWKPEIIQNVNNACNHKYSLIRTSEYASPSLKIDMLIHYGRHLKQPG